LIRGEDLSDDEAAAALAALLRSLGSAFRRLAEEFANLSIEVECRSRRSRPGGRLSIFEPINNYFPRSPDEFWGFDARGVRDLVAKVWEYEGWVESSCARDPMMNFTEKDLVRCAEDAGFREVHVELLVDVEPGTWVVDWERMLNTSPNPNARTIGEALRGALSDEGLARFEKHVRPLTDAGRSTLRSAFAYLRAAKT
jgi:arsenite methyltransferase